MKIKKILIIGSGAREHAIAAAFNRSPQPLQLFCAAVSNNPGIKVLCTGYEVINILDPTAICAVADEWKIDLAIIGPEAPLEKGIADALQTKGIAVIGPTQKLARIETSKFFTRNLMQTYKIPGSPQFKRFTKDQSLQSIADYLLHLGSEHYVIKADGLMGGKGVKVAGEHLHKIEDALDFCREIFASQGTVVIEEKLIGQEFSLMCFCDGQTLVPMPLVQDHKRAFVDDKGPNTGGMGSYSCADHSLPFLDSQDVQSAYDIMLSVLHALQMECLDRYIGILYGSFIATRDGVYVIEFNARFGDPESLNVLTILESDLLAICTALEGRTLHDIEIVFSQQATVCKYKVPEGYPDQPKKNALLRIDRIKDINKLYFAAVDQKDEQLLATGSRAAAYVGVAPTLEAAERLAEEGMNAIQGEFYHRKDIGSERLIKKRIEHMQKLRNL